jgi:hypothetical protein
MEAYPSRRVVINNLKSQRKGEEKEGGGSPKPSECKKETDLRHQLFSHQVLISKDKKEMNKERVKVLFPLLPPLRCFQHTTAMCHGNKSFQTLEDRSSWKCL